MLSDRRNLDLETALEVARADYQRAHPKSQQYFEDAKSVMPGGNTRSVLHYGPYPFIVASGAGAQIVDADGHKYADFLGEYTAGLYGHNHPIIESAIIEALNKGVTLGGPNLVEAKFASTICNRFSAVERVRFCNSGTESNILALSAARAFTGRSDVLVADRSYHGGVLTYSGNSPLNIPYPTHRMTYNDSDAAAEQIRALGNRLAAVLVEPMIGAGGCIPADSEFLQALRDATSASGALLIFDEVMTSRLTAGGLQGYHRINPDLATFGKYLGGGLTFGAFGGSAEIMDHFDPSRPDAWSHAGTFNNNILTMAAGYAGLNEVYTSTVADRFFDFGNTFRNELSTLVSAVDIPLQLTGLGSMMAFHLTGNKLTAPPDPAAAPMQLLELLHLDMIERGQYYARRGMINISLPMTESHLQSFAQAFLDVLEIRAPLIRSVLEAD